MADSFAHAVGTLARLSQKLPASYVQLLLRKLQLEHDDRALELGCGTGDLAVRISDCGIHVTAVDRSEAMLRAARQHVNPRVDWVQADVNNLNIEESTYRAVYSFESIHLFDDPARTVLQLKCALASRGTFGVGWRLAEWEVNNADLIRRVFSRWGVPMHDWGYWTCPQFAEWLDRDWMAPSHAEVEVTTSTSVVEATDFLCSIERASMLEPQARSGLREDLLRNLSRNARDGELEGTDRFALAFTRLLH